MQDAIACWPCVLPAQLTSILSEGERARRTWILTSTQQLVQCLSRLTLPSEACWLGAIDVDHFFMSGFPKLSSKHAARIITDIKYLVLVFVAAVRGQRRAPRPPVACLPRVKNWIADVLSYRGRRFLHPC